MLKKECLEITPEAPNSQQLGLSLSHLPPSRKRGEALRRIGEALLVLADLDDETEPPPPPPSEDPWLSTEQIHEIYDIGYAALRAAVDRGELTVSRGARRQMRARRSEIDRWLASRRVAPRPRKSQPISADPLDRMLAAGELRATRGRR